LEQGLNIIFNFFLFLYLFFRNVYLDEFPVICMIQERGECPGKYCLLREIYPKMDLSATDLDKLAGELVLVDWDVLVDVNEGCQNHCARKYIAERRFTIRMLEQQRCISDYRYLLGEKEHRKVSSAEAAKRWIRDGFAESFSEVWKDYHSQGRSVRHWDLYVDTEKRRLEARKLLSRAG